MTLREATQADSRGFSILAEQVAELREFSQNPKQRVRTGIPSLDYLTEGPAPGEVYTIVGRSFAGKSQVATNIMANNPYEHLLFFSLEMPARQALTRLYSTFEGIENREVLAQMREGRLSGVLDTLPERLPHQVIVDKAGLTLGDMSFYLTLYDEYFGQRPQATIIDYLELVQGGTGEGHFRTEMVAKALKDWSKDEEIAVFLLHQTNRSEPEWDPPTVDSARAAGYTESDVVVGMWQPATNPKLTEVERSGLLGKVRMNVLKNRINGRVTHGKYIELILDVSLRLIDVDAEQVRRYYR